MDFSSVFGKIGSADVTQRGDFVRDGKYLLEVSEIRLFQGQSGPTHVAELIVREAVAKKAGVEPNAVGSKVSFVNVIAGKTKDVAPSKIKDFCLTLVGKDVKQTPAQEAASVVERMSGTDTDREKGKLARGMLIRGETYEFTSRAGNHGVGINWTHVPGQTKEERQARAAAQEGK